MKLLTRAALVTLGLALPAFASAQGWSISIGVGIGAGPACTTAICGVANTILFIINGILVPVIFAVAFIIFLYGIAKAYIFSQGDPVRVQSGHRLMLWGLVGFAVMISIWGLVNVVVNTFGLGGYAAPAPPTAY